MAAIQNLRTSSTFNIGDLGPKMVKTVINELQKNKKLTNKEVDFIHELVGRARTYNVGLADFSAIC